MIHGNYDISKVSAIGLDGTVFCTILDDDGKPLTTPNVVFDITLPDPGEDYEGQPEVTESGLTYGEGSMTSKQLVDAIEAELIGE
jgi:hypothetical protein